MLQASHFTICIGSPSRIHLALPQSRFYATIFLPWCLKPFYSWVSVNYPVMNQHRRPYIVLCSLGSALMYIVTALFVQTDGAAFVVRVLVARVVTVASPR